MGDLVHPLFSGVEIPVPDTPLSLAPLIPCAGGYIPTQEAHRRPDTQEVCYTSLSFDKGQMIATCPVCGRTWDVILADQHLAATTPAAWVRSSGTNSDAPEAESASGLRCKLETI